MGQILISTFSLGAHIALNLIEFSIEPRTDSIEGNFIICVIEKYLLNSEFFLYFNVLLCHNCSKNKNLGSITKEISIKGLEKTRSP
jgi:hypothetical protein